MKNEEKLKQLLTQYWIKTGRIGKHSNNIVYSHYNLLNSTLKVKPEDLFEQIYKNKFNPENYLNRCSWSKVISDANLSEYLNEEYIKMALCINDSRPALGKGEFLLVSCFGNLGLAHENGDIITLDSKLKIEMKGKRASLNGDSKQYKEMSKRIMVCVFNSLGLPINSELTNHEHFNRSESIFLNDVIKKHNISDENISKMFMHLQNYNEKLLDKQLATCATKLFRQSSNADIFSIVAAEQLCVYAKLEKFNYLTLCNDNGFQCFKTPLKNFDNEISYEELQNALRIINNLSISSWYTGTKSMEISIQ